MSGRGAESRVQEGTQTQYAAKGSHVEGLSGETVFLCQTVDLDVQGWRLDARMWVLVQTGESPCARKMFAWTNVCLYCRGVARVGEACLAVTCSRPCVCVSTGGKKIQTHTIAFELTRRKCSWILMAHTCNFSGWEVKGKIRIQGPASLATREREVLGRKILGSGGGMFSQRHLPRCFQEIS